MFISLQQNKVNLKTKPSFHCLHWEHITKFWHIFPGAITRIFLRLILSFDILGHVWKIEPHFLFTQKWARFKIHTWNITLGVANDMTFLASLVEKKIIFYIYIRGRRYVVPWYYQIWLYELTGLSEVNKGFKPWKRCTRWSYFYLPCVSPRIIKNTNYEQGDETTPRVHKSDDKRIDS